MSAHRTFSSIRPEAGILDSAQLTDAQQTTGRQVLQLLCELCTQAQTAAGRRTPDHDLPRLEQLRYSQTLLIDGERGSGKTALLVTILDALKGRAFRGSWPVHLDNKLPWPDRDCLAVPVDLVDLAPLPPSSNVLLHVAQRLERIVSRIEDKPAGRAAYQAPPWHPDASAEVSARKHWRSLMSSIALGWDRHVDRRIERQDLDTYARELEHAERMRQDLKSCADNFIDELSANYRKKFGVADTTQLVFLIAIDDADMNPQRTVELIDSVRLLSHPQLVFLLTGDSGLFEETLRLHTAGTLAAPLRHLPMSQQASDVGSHSYYVNRIAQQTYDKLIPPSHRCRIMPLQRHERLKHPLHRLGGSADGGGSLQERLMRVRLPKPIGGCPTLSALFDDRPQLIDALPKHLRPLIDLGLQVDRLVGTETLPESTPSWGPVNQVIELLWRLAARHVGYSPSHPRHRWVRCSVDNEWLEVDTGKEELLWELDTEPGPYGQYTEGKDDGSIRVSFLRPHRLDGQEPDSRPLHRRVGAVLQLAAAVTAAQEQRRLWSLPSKQTGYEEMFAAARVYRRPSTQPLRCAWPLPSGLSLLDMAALIPGWMPPEESEEFGIAALKNQAELFLRRIAEYGLQRVGVAAPSQLYSQHGVYRLIDALAFWDASSRAPQELAFQEWALGRAGLLAAPESGLPPDVANPLLASLRRAAGPEYWQQMRRALRKARRQRLAASSPAVPGVEPRTPAVSEQVSKAAPSAPEAIDSQCGWIDKQYPEYDWDLIVEKEISEETQKALKRINIDVAIWPHMLEYASAKWLRTLKGMLWKVEAKPDNIDVFLYDLWLQTNNQAMHAYQEIPSTTSPDSPHGFVRMDGGHLRVNPIENLPAIDKFEQNLQALTPQGVPFTLNIFRGRTQSSFLYCLYTPVYWFCWERQQCRLLQQATPFYQARTYAVVDVDFQIGSHALVINWVMPLWRVLRSHINMCRLVPVHEITVSSMNAFSGLDGISYLFIMACLQAAMGQSDAKVDINHAASPQDWPRLCQQITTWMNRSTDNPEAYALREFFPSGVLIMAAPESGLTKEAARAILAAVQPHAETDAQKTRLLADANVLRRERLSAALKKSEIVESKLDMLLDQLESDGRAQNHPFQLYMDELASAPSVPAQPTQQSALVPTAAPPTLAPPAAQSAPALPAELATLAPPAEPPAQTPPTSQPAPETAPV